MKAKKKSGKLSARNDVKRLIAQIARMDVKKIKESDRIREDLCVDSLASMEILAAIEKKLGIVIDEAKAFDIVTVEDLLDLVTSCVKK